MYGIGGERELDEQSSTTCPATRARGRCGSATPPTTRSQHDVWGACSTRSTCTPVARSLDERVWPIIKRQVEPRSSTGASPTAASGRCAASPSTSPPRRSCAGSRRPRRAPGRDARGRARRALAGKAADEIHADICEHGVDERGVFVQHYDTTALDASLLLMPLLRFLPPDDPRIRATVLAIADELTEDGLVLRYRVEETDDGLAGRGGHVHDLLVLAGLGAGRDRRAGARPGPVREAALLRQPARPLRRGDRPAHRPAPRQLPAGVHPPGADQRGHARDPRRVLERPAASAPTTPSRRPASSR
jgi:hypothetical protein